MGRISQRPGCSHGKIFILLGGKSCGLHFFAVVWVPRFLQKMGRALLGRRLGCLDPLGQCASAHSIHLLECPREVWAAWRALFVPYQKGAGGGFERSAGQAFCLCKNAQGVWADWFGLHLLAAEGEGGSSGSQSPDLGRHEEARLPPKLGMDQLLLNKRDSPLAVKRVSTTTSAGLSLKSSGRIGRVRW